MSAVGFLGRRLLSGIGTLAVIASLMFFIMRLAGDPAVITLGEFATDDALAAFRHRHGLDLPLWQQYANFLIGIPRGELGISFRYDVPALPLVLSYVPATLKLGAVALLLSLLMAVPIGIVSALKPGSLIDGVSRIFAVAGQSVPIFFLGILLILIFAVNLRVLPAFGVGSWEHLVLPGFALSVYLVPTTMRLVRSSMLDALSQDYVQAARARGFSSVRVIFNHALRNALVPVVTVIGLRVSALVGGAVVLEEVFAYPGLGRLAIESMRRLDYAVVQTFSIVVATLIIATSLIVDLLYMVLDPRIRVE